jgi:chromate transporter
MNGALLLSLAWRFGLFSLMAVGGVNALVPEIHRQVVVLNHWMSNADFTGLFAIAQAAPGPNMLFVTLIGWKVAGLAGALVATLALCLPSSLLTYQVVRLRERFSDAPWRQTIEHGLAPVTIGLTLGSGWLLLRTANAHWSGWGLSVATIPLALSRKLNPLWLLAAGALLGLTGWF